jgi:hypothetical protein
MVMTPKEKAREIFNKMYTVEDPMGKYPMCFDSAKECALIAVDEILNQDKGAFDITEAEYHFSYWNNVQEEIVNLK